VDPAETRLQVDTKSADASPIPQINAALTTKGLDKKVKFQRDPVSVNPGLFL
jgi:hypothetical protein